MYTVYIVHNALADLALAIEPDSKMQVESAQGTIAAWHKQFIQWAFA
jgi:hypothetical protein